MTMSLHAQVTRTVDDLLQAWNDRDLDRFTAMLTEDVHWHDLGMLHPPAVGRDAVRRFTELALRAFPDFTYEIRHPICVAEDGSRCVVPWTISATNTGPYDPPGLAPTGRRLRFSGLDYMEFRGGFIARIETRFDPAEAIEQLTGVSVRPRAGSGAEWWLVRVQRLMAAWLRRRARMRVP
jgi:predicted ester cyclase